MESIKVTKKKIVVSEEKAIEAKKELCEAFLVHPKKSKSFNIKRNESMLFV